ncbi:MAG: N-methyl-L-tryptophan oxidase [Isosphaeraceae bacterium]|nr:N-methyl-L-tryptophan oxidase [Isosphaeraceae bacterium]
MERIEASFVILGAGAFGSAAAWQLAKRGENVLLLDRERRPHSRGSSHGTARITRHSYADLRYARAMLPAYQAWRELEADAGRPLLIGTGGVSLCDPEVDYVRRVADNLREIGIPHRRMTGAELRRSVPVFEVPERLDAVFEPQAGIVLADTTLGAELEIAERLGEDRFRFFAETPIERIDLEADRPTLIGNRFRIEADFLIVAAGAWITKLLPEWARGLAVTRQQVIYLRPHVPEPFAIGRFPIFVHKGDDGDGPGGPSFYGMPAVLDCPVKVARHSGPLFDPDRPDRPFDHDYIEVVRSYLRRNIPALADLRVEQVEVCLYTEAPDENFRIGTLPGRPDVLVASPCSGHGFKFSPLIGRVLADLAVAGESSHANDAWTFVPVGP